MKVVESSAFFKLHYALADAMIKSSRVRVAAMHGSPDTNYGFIMFRPDEQMIDCVYVIKGMRNQGLAKALVADSGLTSLSFSTWSQDVTNWAYEKYKPAYYPYWMRFINGSRRQETTQPGAVSQND